MNGIDLQLSCLFGLLAFGAVHLARVVFQDGLAPLGVYLGVTFSTLALWHLKLASLVQISLLAYSIIFVSVLGFVFGAFIAAPRRFLGASGPNYDAESIVRGGYLRSAFYFFGLLSTIGWLALLVLFVADHSLATIWQEPYLLQFEFQSTRYVGYLNVAGILVLPTYALLRRARDGARWLRIVFVVSALIGLLLAGVKSYLVFSMVTTLFVWGSVRKGGAPIRYMVVTAVSFVLFMIAYDRIIDIFAPSESAQSLLADSFPGLYRPYLYLVGPWSALSVLADNPIPQPVVGYQSLSTVWKILGNGLGVVDAVPDVEFYSDIASNGTQGFNVYSMAGGLYWDFRLIGVLLGTAFWGFVSTRLHLKARRTQDWVWILVSAIVRYGLFLSFFTYYFTTNLLFLIAVVLFAYALRGAASQQFSVK